MSPRSWNILLAVESVESNDFVHFESWYDITLIIRNTYENIVIEFLFHKKWLAMNYVKRSTALKVKKKISNDVKSVVSIQNTVMMVTSYAI